jgi:hypothetical protein
MNTHPTVEPTPTVTYRLTGPAGTVWLGLGASQVAGLAATVLMAVLLMLARAPLPLTLVLLVVGGAASAWPLAGLTAVQWLPRLTRRAWQRLRRTDQWRQPLEDVRSSTPFRGSAPPAETAAALESPLLPANPAATVVRLGAGAPLRLHAGPAGLAIVEDPHRQTITVVLATTPTGRFGLLAPDAQHSALQQWGSTLATLLHLPRVQHVTWLAHCGPDTHPPASSLEGSSGGAAADRDVLLRDQAELLAQAHGQATWHRQLLAVTLATRHGALHATRTEGTADSTRPRQQRRGRGRGQETHTGQAAHAIAQQAAAALLAADILSYPLTTTELSDELRRLLDPQHPGTAAALVEEEPLAPGCALTPVALSARARWTHCRTDDTTHRTFAVTGWPRTSLRADWLAPLLQHPLTPATSRTLTVQARPVSAAHAARRARASAAKAHLDTADRQRLGFTAAATSALDAADAEQTEAELVAGYPMAEVTALLTLHAPSDSQAGHQRNDSCGPLDAAAADLRSAALTHRLDVRPLHGQHDTALLATLPLGQPLGGRS